MNGTTGTTLLRVLHVYRTYYPDSQGGLEEVIRQICLNTKVHGVESRVLSLSDEPGAMVIRREEARVYRSQLTMEIASCSVSVQAFHLFHRLARWADVIHFHYPWPFGDVLHFSQRLRKPTLVTYHSDIVRQKILRRLYAPLMSRFLNSVDRIICTSPNYFATSDVLSRFEDKVEVIPIGLTQDSYPIPSPANLDEVKREFGQGFMLFVGVLRYYKGLHILLEAIKGAPYEILIVGSGPIEQALKQHARELKLTNVRFTGYLSDEIKVALFKLSRAVVFPSYLRSEAFGVTLLEGAMYSRPLISTEVGSGTSHVNVHERTGLVVPPGSPKALREAMDQLHYRPDMAHLMGKRARERYEQLFTGQLMGRRYAASYNDVLGRETHEPEELPQVQLIGESKR